jgi:alkylation response protein AidB-like acyl-CoA dehydrogenase
VIDQGTDAQRKALLPLFCGERFHAAALAWIEPGPAFEPLLPRTLAEPKGKGFVLSGAKSFVPLADRASHFLVIARNNGGHDAFIVPRDARVVRISEPEKQLGLRALPPRRSSSSASSCPPTRGSAATPAATCAGCSTTRARRSPR